MQDMQLPRKLGQFGCSHLMPNPYGSNLALPTAFAKAVCTMLDTALHHSRQGQMGWLTSALLQQATESGLVKCIDQLAEATAQQLQHANTQTAEALSTLSPGEQVLLSSGLGILQYTASFVMGIQAHMDAWAYGAPAAPSSLPASSTASTTSLLVAALRSLSRSLQTQPDTQQAPGKELSNLACYLAAGMVRVASTAAQRVLLWQSSLTPGEVAGALGPNFLPWADLALLLVTYACALRQHGHLPAVDAQARSSSSSAGNSSSSSSSSTAAAAGWNSRSTEVQLSEDLQDGLPAWQVAQSEVQHVPASHKQLLQVFGVSPQAALWVAAIMVQVSHIGAELPTPWACWLCNPHHLAGLPLSDVGDSTEGTNSSGMLQAQAAVKALQLQVQHWSTQPVLELLMPVLLYGAAHATADDGSSVWAQQCHDTAAAVLGVMRQRRSQAATVAATAASSSSTESSAAALIGAPLPAVARDEMLLLTLNLLQRLQQPKSASGSSSSSSSSAAATAANPSAASAEQAFMHLLMLLTKGPSVAAEQAAGDAGAEAISVVWQQQAGAIFTALESYVRGRSHSCQGSLPAEVQAVVEWVVDSCFADCRVEQPQLLLLLAQAGSSELHVAFFNLLVSLLKLASSGAIGDELSLFTASNKL